MIRPAAARGGPPQPPPPAGRSIWRRLRPALLLLGAVAAALTGGILALRFAQGRASGPPAAVLHVPEDRAQAEAMIATLEKDLKGLRSQNKRLAAKLASYRPRGLYVVIDTGENRLHVMENGKILHTAICSTGSGVRLADPNQPRSWVFDTPRGELTVRGKTTDPIWVKPDWAFIETGEKIPRGREARMEEGILGDYALDLGDGYLIHGTLFERALGLHVTHGCVRMGAKDLEYLYRTVKPGTKVYIV